MGYRTEAVGRLLAATLAAEALTCWPFWADWPTRTYAAHVRWVHRGACGMEVVGWQQVWSMRDDMAANWPSMPPFPQRYP